MEAAAIKGEGEGLARYPLLTPAIDVTQSVDKRELCITTRIAPAEHVYLKHHVFGGMPIVPGAAMMETICEAVSHYCESNNLDARYVVEVREFEILRAISIDFAASRLVKTRVVFTGEQVEGRCVFEAEMVSDAVNAAGKVVRPDRKHCTARVITDVRPRPPEYVRLAPPDGARHFHSTREELYESRLSTHGRLMQSLNGRFSVSEKGRAMYAEFSMDNLESEFVIGNTSRMFPSPLAVDSAFQIFVLGININISKLRLPIGGKGLKLYRPPDPDGVHYVLTRMTSQDDDVTAGQMMVTTANFEKCFEFDEFRFRQPALVAKL